MWVSVGVRGGWVGAFVCVVCVREREREIVTLSLIGATLLSGVSSFVGMLIAGQIVTLSLIGVTLVSPPLLGCFKSAGRCPFLCE